MRKHINDFVPGDCLGDAHYINQGLTELVKSHIIHDPEREELRLTSFIRIDPVNGDGMTAVVDALLKAGGCGFASTNKLIYVVGNRHSGGSITVAYSYDDRWLVIADIGLVTKPTPLSTGNQPPEQDRTHANEQDAVYGAGPAVAEARKALRCLRLEVSAAVADDVERLVEAAFAALKDEITDARIVAAMRRSNRAIEDTPDGYPNCGEDDE